MTTLAKCKTLDIKWDEPNVLPSRGWLLVNVIGSDLEEMTSVPSVSGDLAVGFYVDYPILAKDNPGTPTILAKAYLRLRDYSWSLYMDDHTYVKTIEEARTWIRERIKTALASDPRTNGVTL